MVETMYAVVAPSDDVLQSVADAADCLPPATPLPRSHGAVTVGFAAPGGVTALWDLYQAGCGRVRFPQPRRDGPVEAVLLNTAGGMTDGDTMRHDVTLGRGATAMIASQAAEKIYRSRGPVCTIDTALTVADNATLFWLPQETILFDGARLHRRIDVDVAPGGRLLACESVVFGRQAHGETVRVGSVRDGWRVRRGGAMVWADRLCVEDDIAGHLGRAPAFGGARALASLVYVGPDVPAWEDPARDWIGDLDVRAGVTALGDVLVFRLIADDGFGLRRALGTLIERVGSALAGRPTPLPAVWAC